MNLHEYQSKQLFARYGIPVPAGYPAHTADDAEAVEPAVDAALNKARHITSPQASHPSWG